jgi:hypothetical protein
VSAAPGRGLRWRSAALVAGVALAAFLPFLRGTLRGEAFFFRDLSRQFFPLRHYLVDGLRIGELRYWNPLLHEGEPVPFGPLAYPVDLLQVLLPDEVGFSLLLALHVPLGAVGFFALARSLGCSRVGASGGALAYALGGFSLSMLNLYVYAQAAGWAPLAILGLMRAAERGGRFIGAAALAVGLAASTGGAELVLQALLLGVVLALPLRRQRGLRVALALLLGAGLAAPAWLPLRSQVAESARGAGLPVDVVVSQSVHPLSLPQVVIGNWHGDLANLINRWWGSNFFPLGFPYVLSLYLGASALGLAAVGAAVGRGPRRRLALLLVAALVLCLGRWAGLAALLEAVPLLRMFRFPVKAFFMVHACAALLAALGLDVLGRGEARGWRMLAACTLGVGGLLVALQWLPLLAPGGVRWFLRGFLPPSYAWADRLEAGHAITADAAVGGWCALGAGAAALLVLAGRLAPATGAWTATALLVGDLLRTGAGLNPTVTSGFYRLSLEMQAVTAELGSSGGRLFSRDPEYSPAFFRARWQQVFHDVWTFAVYMEMLTPDFNARFGVPTALSRDLTMLVPESRVLSPEEFEQDTGAILPRLRRAGVTRVISIEPLSHPALARRAIVRPPRIAPLQLHVYALAGAPPLREVAREVRRAGSPAQAEALLREPAERGVVVVEGEAPAAAGVGGRVLGAGGGSDLIALQAEADAPSVVVIRDAWAPGWEASVNGAPAPVLRADGRHRAVPIGPGRSQVELRYHPPGLRLGLAIGALSLGGLGVLLGRP